MKKQTAQKCVLIISCVVLLIVIFYRSFLYDKEEDGGEIHQEKSDKETIKNIEGWRLFDYLAVVEGVDNKTKESQSKETERAMTCGEFRDALYSVCRLLDINYHALIPFLPERLYTVEEDDLLYLEEFLYMYGLIIESAKEAGRALDINEKHVYIYGHTDLINKSSSTKELITSEGEYLKFGKALDYSDVLKKINDADKIKEDSTEDTDILPELEIRGYEDRLIKEDECLDKSFKILCSGNEIIYFIEETNEKFILHNAWVVNGKDKKISIFAEGVKREINSLRLSEEITGSIADITIQNGQIVEITIKQGAINGKVLMTDDKYIEIEGYGKLEIDPYMRIYKIYDELEMEQTNVVLVGYSNTDFIVINGKICAALITQKITAKNIRVLIKTDNFTSNFHENVVLTSDKSFIIKQGESEASHEPGEEITISKADVKNGRITIIPESENAKITLLSLKRSSGNPSYRGTIEIADNEAGLIIINDLSLEEYLYAVVPSEMPTSYSLEALKVQAVCARSYAYNQLMGNQYRAYGAHVDDSVNYQVYNNIAEDEKSIFAVKETYGMVMEYEGNVITAFYFSTSSGHTASVEDVWENGTTTPYLTGSYQTYDKPYIDFSDEKTFRDFIFEKPINIDNNAGNKVSLTSTYDSGYSYYRWNTTITVEELTKRINNILNSRYQANKASILTQVTEKEASALSGAGEAIIKTVAGRTFISKSISSIGSVKNITVTERGSSGIIKELMIEGDEAVILVSYQTNVRMLLAPVNSEIFKADQTTLKSMSMLPSAYCVIDKVTEGQKTAFLITGGGYGHGVGMSQNGARTMALEGKTYKEILEHYYPGIDLILIYIL